MCFTYVIVQQRQGFSGPSGGSLLTPQQQQALASFGCAPCPPFVAQLGRPDSRGSGNDRWECPRCNFSNANRNEKCGGNGPLGCDTPKPASLGTSHWVCPGCGFRNVQRNTKCGGNGDLGCNAPRPASGEMTGDKRKRADQNTDGSQSKKRNGTAAPALLLAPVSAQ